MKTMYCVFFMIAAASYAAAHDPLPKDLSQDMYCTGCAATVKELGKYLQYHSSEKMEKRISDLMKQICEEDHFNGYDFSAKKLVLACKHLIENHKSDLVPLLKDHYGSKNRRGKTYLDIAHKVCNQETFACTGGVKQEHKDEPGKGKVVYNEEKDDFDIHFGDNVKIVQPVRELGADSLRLDKHDEL